MARRRRLDVGVEQTDGKRHDEERTKVCGRVKKETSERSVCPTMNLGCWGEIVTTYNPNTRVVFLCTHRGTLELSWPLEKEL